MEEWKPFRKALSKRERTVFDEMLNAARLYGSASSSAARTSKFEGMTMALIFHRFKVLRESTEKLDQLKLRVQVQRR